MWVREIVAVCGTRDHRKWGEEEGAGVRREGRGWDGRRKGRGGAGGGDIKGMRSVKGGSREGRGGKGA